MKANPIVNQIKVHNTIETRCKTVCYLLNGFLLKDLSKYNPLTCFLNDIYYSGNSSIFTSNKINILSCIRNNKIAFLDSIFPEKEYY